MEQFEEKIGEILADFREHRTNFPQAIVAIENLILDRLGFTLAMLDRSLRVEKHVKDIIIEEMKTSKKEQEETDD